VSGARDVLAVIDGSSSWIQSDGRACAGRSWRGRRIYRALTWTEKTSTLPG
jgi:hypothetical protein